MIWKLIKWALTLAGIWLIFQTLIVIITVACDVSNLFPALIGVIIISIAWGAKWLIRVMGEKKWVKYTVYALIFLFVASFVLVEGLIINSQTKAERQTDAIIVLGAGLNGEVPTWILSNRLESAVEYLNAHPETIAVVSGGQGYGETISEAAAMKKYLTGKGIDEKRVYLEDKSTSTLENFQFSKKILDDIFKRTYTVSYVTNKFHLYRAGLIAKKMGLEAYPVPADDVPVVLVNTYCREYFAVIYYYLQNII